MKKIEQTLRVLWDNIKHTNICAMKVLNGEEGEKDRQKLKNDWKLPKSDEKLNVKIQEIQQILSRIQTPKFYN